MKIFRDDIYGRLRMIFPADHRAYARMGLYKTFPQADLRQRLQNMALPLFNLPPIRKKIDKMLKKGMVVPYKQVVAKAQSSGGVTQSVPMYEEESSDARINGSVA